MKKYLVKETSIATEDNPSFAGQTAISWMGKGDTILKHVSPDGKSDCDLLRYTLDDYGYDRECDAKRNWTYKNPENDKYWTSTVEIVEVEC